MHVDETEALVAAQQAVGFPVGHASAQQVWRGLRSRPTWRVLCYSAEDPPHARGLVLVDAVDGTVVEQLVEDNPERGTPRWRLVRCLLTRRAREASSTVRRAVASGAAPASLLAEPTELGAATGLELDRTSERSGVRSKPVSSSRGRRGRRRARPSRPG